MPAERRPARAARDGTWIALGIGTMPRLDVHAVPTDHRLAFGDHTVLDLAGSIPLSAIRAGFATVPRDEYVADGTRFKSIFRARIEHDRMLLQDHGPLYQSATLNYGVYGADSRVYAPMDMRLRKSLEPAVRSFAAAAGLGPEHEILIQAQRVMASAGAEGRIGIASREGWHSDGTTVVGVLLVDRVNVMGGVSMLATDPRGAHVVLARTLAPGELLLIDDRRLWHDVTNIERSRCGAPGFRDVVLMGYPACREPERRAA